MGRYIPNAFNLWVVVYVALGSTACSYGMAILGFVLRLKLNLPARQTFPDSPFRTGRP